MQLAGQLSGEDFNQRIEDGEFAIRVGPYVYRIQSDLVDVASGVKTLYAGHRLADPEDFVDFNVSIRHGGFWQRMRDKVEFFFDGTRPFDSIPLGQAYAFLEWGMNWCVSLYANEYLKLHAAIVSRDDATIIMPGVPGSGKSTLCAALGLRGWRILSDEHALIEPDSTKVVPLCRPVSLKNESIEAIRSLSSDAVFGPTSRETHKGRVAHMKADLHPDSHDPESLKSRWMIFPRYCSDEPQRLAPRRRTDSFILAAYHSFNYSLLCETGFEIMKTLISTVECFDLVYHDLEWAMQAIDRLTSGSVSR